MFFVFAVIEGSLHKLIPLAPGIISYVGVMAPIFVVRVIGLKAV